MPVRRRTWRSATPWEPKSPERRTGRAPHSDCRPRRAIPARRPGGRPMAAPLQSLADRFAFKAPFLDMLTEGFDDADWLRRGGPGNHAQWLVGHLARSRRAALRAFGQPVEEQPWEQDFAMGQRPTPQSDDIAPAQLREAFFKNGAALRTFLEGLTPERAAESCKALPDGSDTLAGAAHFLHFHETYHLGQIGLLRRISGKNGVV